MTAEAAGVSVSPWLGWIRQGSGFPPSLRTPQPDRVELGPAVFSLPEAPEAGATSWACRQDCFCVFSGYLYNLSELCQKLDGRGRLASSAAEVVLSAYARWGQESVSRLEGVWAFALWDQSAETLLCGRDAMGQHPFFYAQPGGGLVFSWDIEALRRHPSVPRDFNRVVLAEHLMQRWMDQEETYFLAIRRLPGGCGLKFSQGRAEVFRYWEPAPPGRPIEWVSREELAQFPDLLRKAVDRTLQYGPIGILLSGGFDSVSVAVWAKELAGQKHQPAPKAYSVVFPTPKGLPSEEPVQRSVAESLGFPQTTSFLTDYLGDPGILERLTASNARYPAPPFHLFSPAYLDLLRKAREDGCAAVLSGEGGDEWLTVGPHYAADLIRTGNWAGLFRLLQTGLRSWVISPRLWTSNIFWTYGLRALIRQWVWRKAPGLAIRRRRQFVKDAVPDWLAPDAALRRELIERFERWERPTADGSSAYVAAVRHSFHYPVTTMAFEERFSRDWMGGVPSLHPYWDRALVDFLARVPPELLNAGGRSKALVRQAMEDRFPGLGFRSQKKQTVTELCGEIYRREGPVLWKKLGAARFLAGLGLVDLDRFHDMLAAWTRSNAHPRLHMIWYTAGVESWVRAKA